jgi:uncharacterized protein YukE
MSEIILKAVANAIAASQHSFEQQLQDILSRVDAIKSGVSLETVEALVEEVKSMHQSLFEEVKSVQQSALNKTSFVEQELRSAICAETKKVLDIATNECKSISESLEALKQDVNQLNDDTLALVVKNFDIVSANVTELSETVKTTNEAVLSVQTLVESINLKEGPKGEKGQDGWNGKDGNDGVGIILDYWKAGIHREGSLVLHYLGQYFRAKCDTISEPGIDDTWERLGSAGFRHRGGFDPEKTYEVGDMYVKDFATFACIGAEHVLLAARGPVGPKGEKGNDSTVAGPAGRDGATVLKVHSDESGFVLEMSDASMHAVPFPSGIQSLFKSPGDYLPISQLKSIAASTSDFKSFQAALLQLEG